MSVYVLWWKSGEELIVDKISDIYVVLWNEFQ
jgi:hypothetical protein